MPYSSQTVVVTGASAGVGRATAHRFARGGWNVALIARDQPALEQVAHEVEELGGTGMVFPLDVTDAPAMFAAADAVATRCGGIDVWVNDAMVTVFSPVWKITPEEFHRVTDVTYMGFVHGTMAALRHMRARNSGTIIQIGSALAYRGIPLQAAYCGAKYAIRGFTDALRTELIHDHSAIKVTIVELPGREHTAIRLGADAHGKTAASRRASHTAGSRRRDRIQGGAQSQARILARILHSESDPCQYDLADFSGSLSCQECVLRAGATAPSFPGAARQLDDTSWRTASHAR